MDKHDTAGLDKLKVRIQALRAKTIDNGCTEDEALSAAAKVAELLDIRDPGGLSMRRLCKPGALLKHLLHGGRGGSAAGGHNRFRTYEEIARAVRLPQCSSVEIGPFSQLIREARALRNLAFD